METFTNILNILRNESGKSQVKVATDLGLSAQAYSYMVKNGREPSYETLCKISEYFNVSIDYLLGKSSYKVPQATDLKVKDFEALKVNLNNSGGPGTSELINSLNRLLGKTLSSFKKRNIDIDALILKDVAIVLQKWCDIIETAGSVIIDHKLELNENKDTVKYEYYITAEDIKNVVIKDGVALLNRLRSNDDELE
jgi:transcriptional regulator with XRE-family HTH domain